ncbi:MAG: family 43 glycosylhydrolase [Verrucomicrobia bacterium]|nr:family 43 glycosylhydrolase [Verrucomicrobiota bacterium]
MTSTPIRPTARLAYAFAGLLAMIAMPLAIHAANPFLPGYEYIPDGDPHVFGDRVYLYGSHDLANSQSFCDYILKVWSAPLNDLNTWTDHGVVLATRDIDGRKDDVPWSDNQFYAPDIAKIDGKYYLFAQIVGAPCAVAVGDTPAGPFKVITHVQPPAGAPIDFGVWAQYFDPGLLVDDDGKVYLYYGGGRSYMVQLDPKNPTQVLPDTYQIDVLSREAPFKYQEGPSPRKINGTYYLVYARGADLAYATSDAPTGPFNYRGVIVSNSGDAHGGNIHGGLAKLNGQWYIFYHRQTNKTVFSRRACAEPVTIKPDGSIPQVEQTSQGFEPSLDPYKVTPADIACVFRGGSYVTELDKRTRPVMGNRNGCVVGYKYFDFGDIVLPGQSSSFTLQFRNTEASGQVEVWLGDPKGDGEKLGAVLIDKQEPGKDAWREITVPVRNISGRHAIYFRFTSDLQGAPIADIRSFAFTRDTQ